MANPLHMKIINPALDPNEEALLHDLAKSVAHPNMKILEVGTGQGGSAGSLYINVVQHYDGTIYTIDIVPPREITALSSIYPQIKFMIGRSEDFLKILSPFAEFDLIFIDGSHIYQDVLSDIQLSLPLVREGGILCGHDCENKYTNYDEGRRAIIDKEAEEGQESFCHAGVVKALYVALQDNYEVAPRIWYVKKITA